MSDLTERLREGMIWIPELHEFEETETQSLMEQAADALEAQEARIAELEAALHPVMNLEMWTESADDKEICLMSMGTVRAMRSALTPSLPK